MKLKFFKGILILAMLGFQSAKADDDVTQAKQYPPYPDIWGYDFSKYPAVKRGEGYMIAYEMPNGDYWFKARKDLKLSANKIDYEYEKYDLVKLFEGKIEKLTNQEELRNFSEKKIGINGISKYSSLKKITFSNGETLELEEVGPNARYCHIDNVKTSCFIKRDKQGNEINRYSILTAMPKVKTVKDTNTSQECSVPSEFIHRQLNAVYGPLLLLEDDTFLLFDDNILVRFDQNLKTKFKPVVNYQTRHGQTLKTNLFVIPNKIIEDLAQDLYQKDLPVSQGVQDGAMEYIIENLNN